MADFILIEKKYYHLVPTCFHAKDGAKTTRDPVFFTPCSHLSLTRSVDLSHAVPGQPGKGKGRERAIGQHTTLSL